MIEITNAEVLEANDALKELSRERLPVAGALRVRQVMRQVQQHMEDIEGVRQDLLRQHGRKGEDGELALDERGQVTFEGEGLTLFAADYNALMAERTEFTHGIRVSDLGSIEVQPAVLVGLGPLLEEEGE